MRGPRLKLLAVVLFLAGFTGLGAAERQAAGSLSIPARLTDQQFWRLSTEFSEPPGYFRSENLVSNEHTFQYVIPALKRQVKPGGCTSAWRRTRTSPTSSPPSHGWRSSSTSAGAICSST
jgi:hypothetical protein